MLLGIDMGIMAMLHHPTATLQGIDMRIMDMLPWTDMPTMDTLHHPTVTRTDMRIMDTRLPLTPTPQGSNMAGGFKATLLHPRVAVLNGPSFYSFIILLNMV